jgi:hypothetical protein
MDDIFTKPTAAYSLRDFRLSRMVLSPAHWQSCALPVQLGWEGVKFEPQNATSVPADARGVYTFVVQPGIAEHPSCSYLMYVGMARRQGLRGRFCQYLDEKAAGEQSRRVHVTDMLLKWDGFLWFYYAALQDETQIKPVEDELLTAYLPPVNKSFPSTVSRDVRRLFED